MRVSVIIPTYKRPSMLSRAIDSVLKQTFQNFEILVVDDNNQNSEYRKETEKFMKQYRNNKRIRYIKRDENGGGCIARNTGIENAKGEYIAFLDDDDEFMPSNLEKQLNNIEKNNLDVSVCASVSVDENNNEVSRKKYDNFERYNDVMIFHIMEMLVGTQTFLVKTQLLKKVNGFTVVPAGHEYVLMYKLIEAGAKVGVVNEVLTKLNVHSEGRISVSHNKIKGEKYIFTLKRKYFNKLSFNQKSLVRYRYYSITFETYQKLGHTMNFIYYFILALLVKPEIILKRIYNKTMGKGKK